MSEPRQHQPISTINLKKKKHFSIPFQNRQFVCHFPPAHFQKPILNDPTELATFFVVIKPILIFIFLYDIHTACRMSMKISAKTKIEPLKAP